MKPRFALPKPKDKPKKAPKGFKTLPDGREICWGQDPREYRRRTKEGGERQSWICCLYGYAPMCPGKMDWYYGEGMWKVTLEHEHGRGMNGGHRDDRMVIDGKWHNGAAHLVCNQWKGSRRIDYNTAIQAGAEGRKP
jgi:hypothetical protein